MALRELMPAATLELTFKNGLPKGVPSVTLATLLPMAWPALRCKERVAPVTTPGRSRQIRVRIAGQKREIEFANSRSLVSMEDTKKPVGASGLDSFDSPRRAPKITTREMMHRVP